MGPTAQATGPAIPASCCCSWEGTHAAGCGFQMTGVQHSARHARASALGLRLPGKQGACSPQSASRPATSFVVKSEKQHVVRYRCQGENQCKKNTGININQTCAQPRKDLPYRKESLPHETVRR